MPDIVFIVAGAIVLLVLIGFGWRHMLRVQADKTVRDVEDLERR